MHFSQGYTIANVKARFRAPITNDCSMCQLLHAAYVDSPSGSSDGPEDELRCFPFLEDTGRLEHIDDHGELCELVKSHMLLLAVVPHNYRGGVSDPFLPMKHFWDKGYVLCWDDSQPQPFLPAKISKQFNNHLVEDWLRICNTRHENICGRMLPQVSGLKLIDIQTLCVVDAPPSTLYIALSYVWGLRLNFEEEDVDKSFHGPNLPRCLPSVVQDTIAVAIALGFRHVWIDKYCIDQNDSTKHYQLQHMDSIYSNAELTVIAVAGQDQHAGLPGVGSRPRSFQPYMELGTFRCASTMRSPHTSIVSSKWSTRGWTFQEAALSRRRLVFTDEQVYFECDEMNCYESFSSSRSFPREGRVRGHLRNCMLNGIFKGTGYQNWFSRLDPEPLGKASTLHCYLTHIEDYTARDLTYDADSLNAFAGMMRHFQMEEFGLLQAWGIPFGSFKSEDHHSFAYGDHLSYTLSWYHVHPCWDAQSRPRRRPDFPSWSWAGWSGPVSYDKQRNGPRNTIVSTSFLRDIKLELKSGGLVSYEKISYSDVLSNEQLQKPTALHFRTSSLRLDCVGFDTDHHGCLKWYVGSYPADVHLSHGPDSAQAFVDGMRSGFWECLVLGHNLLNYFVLVVEQNEKTTKRVGLIVFRSRWKWADEDALRPLLVSGRRNYRLT